MIDQAVAIIGIICFFVAYPFSYLIFKKELKVNSPVTCLILFIVSLWSSLIVAFFGMGTTLIVLKTVYKAFKISE